MPFPITDNNGEATAVKLFYGQGFGLDTDDELESKKQFAIRVSDEIDYCISFWIKQTSVIPSLELSLTGFNCDFSVQKLSKSILDGNTEDHFVKANEKILSIPNRYHFVRYILYSKNQSINPSQPLNSMSSGRNLIMEEGTTNIFINLRSVPLLLLPEENSEPDSINIWNFKVRPLKTPFSTGFLNTTNLLEIWRKNNKKHKSNEEIDNIARNYLLPYNSIQAVINL